MQSLLSQMNSLKTEFKLLEKKTKTLKAAEKDHQIAKIYRQKISGFVKPRRLYDELVNFRKSIYSEMQTH